MGDTLQTRQTAYIKRKVQPNNFSQETLSPLAFCMSDFDDDLFAEDVQQIGSLIKGWAAEEK